MQRQIRSWLTANYGLLLLGVLPAILLLGALLYFIAWAFAYSFTNLELVEITSVNWSWVGLDNYRRLLTRRAFLEALWTAVNFIFFSAIVGQPVLGFLLALALRGSRGRLRRGAL
ncbi:MAG: hypothetical protein MO846_09940 [Candidatus Devosia symbiotica]|nr:hypothetical protein [Candidatus Devosia symbiotica]